MSCGYACVNCGKCKGVVRDVTPEGYCPACKFQNDTSSEFCTQCGMRLPQAPGAARSSASGGGGDGFSRDGEEG